MLKLQIKANELVNTDVNFVSLVKRGANRIPFRITKEDEAMLDLHKIGRSLFRKADPAPEIVAAIVQKGADLTKVAAVFRSAGLDPKNFFKSEKDGVVTLAKADADKAEDAAVLKVSDEVALIVSGLQKAFQSYDFESSSFKEVMATGGYFASLTAAMDAMRTVAGNILYKAESPSQAATDLGKAVDEFKSYLTTLTNSLPVQAFKADVEFSRASLATTPASDEPPVIESEATETQKADAGKNGTGAGFEAGKGTGTDPSATADDAANTAINAKPGEKTTGNVGEDLPSEAVKEEVPGLPQPDGFEPGDGDGFAAAPTDSDQATARASADDKKMTLNGGTTGSSIPDGDSGLSRYGGVRKEGDADIGKKGKGNTLPDHESGTGAQKDADEAVAKSDMTEILAAISALQKSFEGAVEAVKQEVSTLNGRVDEVATMARKTDAALNGTVFNEAGGDAPSRVEKSEGAPPLLDTAFSRSAA